MTTLMNASTQWMNRPDDQRFTSLPELHEFTSRERKNSKAVVVSSRRISVAPVAGVDAPQNGLVVVGPGGAPAAPTHWSFGQLASLAAPVGQDGKRVSAAAYLRALPAPLAADCLNFGLQSRDVEDVGVLLRRDGGIATVAAATGPNYGRVWNSDIVAALMKHIGDGVNGHWRVPGIFGKKLDVVTKKDTTLYASDRDMFVFLADEDRRIELPNRRDGQPGSLARGVFLWNSETGSQTFGIASFLFDYVCCNRIVWGAEGYKELRIRHTASAPDKFIEQVTPAIEAYSQSSVKHLTEALRAAQLKKLTGGLANEDAVAEFLSKRFSRSQVAAIQNAHLADEGRPIETLWDAVTGATAYARSIPYANERVEVERKAGAMLDGVA